MDRKLEDGESIQITVATDGQMEVKALGVKGSGCTEVTKIFEKLGEVMSDRPTSEMREESDEHRGRLRR